MPERTKGEVRLPQGQPQGPYVHPGAPQGAVDHAAAAFDAARKSRQAQNTLPKSRPLVAGGPTPSIPNLAGGPERGGMTMAQHAQAERAPAQAAPSSSGGFVEPAASLGPNQVRPSPAQLDIRPTDELPPQAKEDPDFLTGTGAMFASNQPRLAMKYGVIRGGKLIPPQQLVGQAAPGALRPESVRDLETLIAMQKQQAPAPTAEKAAFTEDDKKEVKEAIADLDEFDFDRYRQATAKDILNNEAQRKLIEERLKPMDVGDLITQGYIIQRVEIIPNKFWVEFKTLDGEIDLALKRIIMEDSRSVDVSERYYLDKFGLMSIAASLHKVNDKPFADFIDEKGSFNDDLFRAKFHRVLKLPFPMLASIGANAFWFDVRVRKLFVAEAVGNG